MPIDLGPPLHLSARWRGLSAFQWTMLVALAAFVGLTAWRAPQVLVTTLYLSLALGFVTAIAVRVAALFATPHPKTPSLVDDRPAQPMR